ncbi:hypothetical protein [Novisyntrophococcus fermenticellae]|uniref:hypothetical protein n=1 Tax=Novisyntrophococcus fermenticellae TaxID=2068655 RepID=UPI001E5F75E0|nr:hypothetical protein [Novisyntrophococcus fermenticellae]
MIFKINKKTVLLSICIFLCGIIARITFINSTNSMSNRMSGGRLHPSLHAIIAEALPVSTQQAANVSERFQRPSKQLPLPNPYALNDFQKENNEPPLISKKFEAPEDLLLAYYGILRAASNMSGYSGGCGSIGESGLPYPYAYELLTKEKQNEISLNQFIDSFKGIGYTTLLKIVPAYAPPDTPQNIKYYLVEIEVITGPKANNDKEYNKGSYFAYYYGLVTVEKTPKDGWKIKDIDYIPEDFLCAPVHSWFYLSDAVVQIVYEDNMKIIEKIDRTKQKGDMVYIYASGNGKQYRFDFIRLTNGYDILLHENVFENGMWKEIQLLTDDWKDFKLTINNSQINKTI